MKQEVIVPEPEKKEEDGPIPWYGWLGIVVAVLVFLPLVLFMIFAIPCIAIDSIGDAQDQCRLDRKNERDTDSWCRIIDHLPGGGDKPDMPQSLKVTGFIHAGKLFHDYRTEKTYRCIFGVETKEE